VTLVIVNPGSRQGKKKMLYDYLW